MNRNTLTPDQKRTGLALLAIRLASAAAFIFHGSGILFGAFGGPGLQGFAGFAHLPLPVAVLVGIAQFGGGLAMLTGVLARLGALGLTAVMAGAVFMVHIHNGMDVQKGGIEYALTQMLVAVAILVAGPGPYTLVALVRRAAGRSTEPVAAA